MAFRLRTLGALELRDADGVPVPGAGSQRKPLLILAIVALQRDGISRDQLLRMVWPGVDPERARASLKQHLYAIRIATGEATIIAGAPTLRVDRNLVAVDVHQIYEAISAGRLVDAAEHLTGEILDSIPLQDNAELAAWVADLREELAPAAALVRSSVAARRATPGGPHRSLAVDRADRLLEEQVGWALRVVRTLPMDPVAAVHRMASVLAGLAEGLVIADAAPVAPERVAGMIEPLLCYLRESKLFREMERAGRVGTISPGLWHRMIDGSIASGDPVGRSVEQAIQQNPLVARFRSVSCWFRTMFMRTLASRRRSRIRIIGAAAALDLVTALSNIGRSHRRTTVELVDPDLSSLSHAADRLAAAGVSVAAVEGDLAHAAGHGDDDGHDLVVVCPTVDQHTLGELVWAVDRLFAADRRPAAVLMAPAASASGIGAVQKHLFGWGSQGYREEDMVLFAGSDPGGLDVAATLDPSRGRWLTRVSSVEAEDMAAAG